MINGESYVHRSHRSYNNTRRAGQQNTKPVIRSQRRQTVLSVRQHEELGDNALIHMLAMDSGHGLTTYRMCPGSTPRGRRYSGPLPSPTHV